MNNLPLFVGNLATITAILTFVWVISLIEGDSSIVDVFWGFGFVVLTWQSIFQGEQWSWHSITLASMVSLWGLRLTVYLGRRKLGKPEDYRYAAMRARYGAYFPVVSLFIVFLLQALLVWIVSLPIQVSLFGVQSWHATAFVGIALWCIGLMFEAVGDYQLASFKSDPRNAGRVMDRGLWRYTRHPNYFGDFLVWWGIFFMCVQPNYAWWIVVSPLLMSFLLIRVSGVRLLEGALRTRIAGYEEYVSKTSSFFPMPPSNSS